MNFLIVELITDTATFRNPDFQNFHKTLTLPPPTTLIGLGGAALGYSPKAAQEFFDENEFYFGVFGESLGKAKDTWKYTNKVKGAELYNYHPDYFGSVITKEILFNNKFLICYGTKNEDALEKLNSAFQTPKFALTLGNSDSIAFIKNITIGIETIKHNIFRNCLVQGDVIDNVLSNPNKKLEFSIYQSAEPVTYDLPIRFNYLDDYGVRTVSNVSTYSYITMEMKLNYDIECVKYEEVFIPICKL